MEEGGFIKRGEGYACQNNKTGNWEMLGGNVVIKFILGVIVGLYISESYDYTFSQLLEWIEGVLNGIQKMTTPEPLISLYLFFKK